MLSWATGPHSWDDDQNAIYSTLLVGFLCWNPQNANVLLLVLLNDGQRQQQYRTQATCYSFNVSKPGILFAQINSESMRLYQVNHWRVKPPPKWHHVCVRPGGVLCCRATKYYSSILDLSYHPTPTCTHQNPPILNKYLYINVALWGDVQYHFYNSRVVKIK